MRAFSSAEQLADSGLDAMRAGRPRGRRADSGSRPSELLDAVPGAPALVIRSATQVTAEVLEAGDRSRRRRPGRDRPRQRRRRGGDPARRDGRERAAVERALGRRAHASRCCSRRPATCPQAERRPARPASGTASRWEGVELHGKTLGIVGLGRVGVLVAQRAHAFGMRLVALRPVRERRARPPARRRARADDRGARRDAPTSSPIHLPKTPETIGLINAERARAREAGAAASSTPARGGIVDEDALADAIARRPHRRRRARRVRDRADHRVAAVRARHRRRHAAPRRVDGRGAGQGRADDRRAGRARAARRLRAVRRQRRRDRGDRDRAARSCRSPSASAGCSPALAGGVVDTLEITLRGRDRRLRLPRAHARRC